MIENKSLDSQNQAFLVSVERRADLERLFGKNGATSNNC
jgi:hypothetical protein